MPGKRENWTKGARSRQGFPAGVAAEAENCWNCLAMNQPLTRQRCGVFSGIGSWLLSLPCFRVFLMRMPFRRK